CTRGRYCSGGVCYGGFDSW
nr:immunoglobulin heavy chain junction region [Macaca mulatta]MOW45800.1 immunoglobulin heavy chain junction region [Macaca mulatta]MOW45853.1 immunoglobulin heavy chain junction region [Macaca mulatta]MOW46042.1 immunoglobulin heavy chain junction region [Macaca mulatta]MOW46289.1 immunoglobulin heavy chain junction region [Macaca mulatta]